MLSDENTGSRWMVSGVGKLYLVIVALECAFLVGTAVATLVISSAEGDEIKFVGILAIYVTVGFLYFAFESILVENVFQFWSSVLCHLMITMYVIWHYLADDLGSFFHKYSFYMMIGICILQGIYLVMAPFVQATFGWRLYKHAGIGGNVRLQACYKTSSIFFSLLKLDLFMGLLLVVLGYFYLSEAPLELGITIGAMVLTFGWAILGWRAVVTESRPLLYVFFALLFLEPAYISFKLWEMYSYPRRFPDDSFTRFAISGGIAVVVRILLLFWTHWCKQNFNMGLRNKVFLRQVGGDLSRSQYAEIRDDSKPLYPSYEHNNA